MIVGQEFVINVVTRLQDNGDGGYTMWVYNTEKEMVEDHYHWKRAKTQEEKDRIEQIILDEDDPYEYGYIGTDRIKVILDDNGQIKLAEPLSFHGGQ